MRTSERRTRLACALFLLGAFSSPGIAQTAWFAAPLSRRFAQPLDGGRRRSADGGCSASTRRCAGSS